jgi:siroheme synthase
LYRNILLFCRGFWNVLSNEEAPVSTPAVETKVKSNREVDELAPVFIDLGKKKKKAVKRLRNGRGSLVGRIQATIEDLRNAGTISATAQPVIVVVREKRKNKGLRML